MISVQHNFIFVHIPKTGGTSIRTWLWDATHDPFSVIFKHFKFIDAKQVLVEDFFNKAFKFTFVRNTWERIVSEYFFSHELAQASERSTLSLTLSFRDFVMNHPIESQLKWINGRDGQSIPDFIGRFEHLEADLNTIAAKIGFQPPPLTHQNKSQHEHYSYYFDDALVDFVKEKYQDEIRTFGYEFKKQRKYLL